MPVLETPSPPPRLRGTTRTNAVVLGVQELRVQRLIRLLVLPLPVHGGRRKAGDLARRAEKPPLQAAGTVGSRRLFGVSTDGRAAYGAAGPSVGIGVGEAR